MTSYPGLFCNMLRVISGITYIIMYIFKNIALYSTQNGIIYTNFLPVCGCSFKDYTGICCNIADLLRPNKQEHIPISHYVSWCGISWVSKGRVNVKVIHKEYSRFLKSVFPHPVFVPWIKHDYSYKLCQHINAHSCKISIWKFLFSLWSLVN